MGFYEATTHPQIKKYEDKRTGKPRYLVRYRTDQNRSTMKRGFTTMRDAKAFLTDMESSKAGGTFVQQSAGRITIGERAAPWLEHKAAVVKPATAQLLRGAWATHVEPRWRDVRLADVRHSDVAAWVTELAGSRSATVVIRAHGLLAGILDEAVRDRCLAANPARGVALPRKGRKQSRYLSAGDVERVAEAAARTALMYRLVVLTLAYTGVRWGEMAALRVKDVNLLRRRLEVTRTASALGKEWNVGTPKGHRSRSVPVPPFLTVELREHMQGLGPEDLIFPAPRTSEYLRSPNKATVNSAGVKVKPKWWEIALDECGLPYMPPHDLRHTAASLAVSAGANVKALQRMLGHTSAAMTLDVYSDLFDDDLDAVGGALDRLRGEHILSTKGSGNPMTAHDAPVPLAQASGQQCRLAGS